MTQNIHQSEKKHVVGGDDGCCGPSEGMMNATGRNLAFGDPGMGCSTSIQANPGRGVGVRDC